MAERLTIVVTPADSGQDLTVEDAMQQVLDAFRLLSSTFPADDAFSWTLIKASTNSPFTVVAEARSKKPGVDVDFIARSQKKNFVRAYQALSNGVIPAQWDTPTNKETARRFVTRNLNGVGATNIQLDGEGQIAVTPIEARKVATLLLEPAPISVAPRSQLGSVEGLIVDVTTYYGKPALMLEDRLSRKKIWCVIGSDSVEKVSAEARFEDVWMGRRVRVRGLLDYDHRGRLAKVTASEITVVPGRLVAPAEITDHLFTNGLTPEEYIDRLREGDV